MHQEGCISSLGLWLIVGWLVLNLCPATVSDHAVPTNPYRGLAGLGIQLPTCEVQSGVKPQRSALWDYFYPAWRPENRSYLSVGDLALEDLVKDPLERLDPVAKPPEKLRGRVLFWSAIYARYTSQMRLVHDRERPEIVYGYFDFSKIYSENSKVAASILANRSERLLMERLENLLTEIESASPRNTISLAEKLQVIKFFRSTDPNNKIPDLRKLISQIRVQTGQSDHFKLALDRSQGYLSYFEAQFESQRLPKVLSRIPFVESSFNNRARSKRGAFGMWQFMPRTAREMIHQQNTERWKDPVHQARAAARLLRRYRRVLPDWPTTITAYNAGVGRVRRLLDQASASDLTGIFKLPENKGGLGFAAKNFFAEFAAASLVEAYQTELLYPELFPQSVIQLRQLAESPISVACYDNTPKEKTPSPTENQIYSTSMGDVRMWKSWFKKVF